MNDKSNRAVVHREIGIDCGHRVPDHGSKCRSPHGHRYRIILSCEGEVIQAEGNEENGMVIDFGNIKQVMMDVLDAVFDHAFVVSKYDAVMMEMYFPGEDADQVALKYNEDLTKQIKGYRISKPVPVKLPRCLISEQDPDGMKIVPVGYTPTAENMAKHMFELVSSALNKSYSKDVLRVSNIRLYETPNGWVDYSSDGTIHSAILAPW